MTDDKYSIKKETRGTLLERTPFETLDFRAAGGRAAADGIGCERRATRQWAAPPAPPRSAVDHTTSLAVGLSSSVAGANAACSSLPIHHTMASTPSQQRQRRPTQRVEPTPRVPLRELREQEYQGRNSSSGSNNNSAAEEDMAALVQQRRGSVSLTFASSMAAAADSPVLPPERSDSPETVIAKRQWAAIGTKYVLTDHLPGTEADKAAKRAILGSMMPGVRSLPVHATHEDLEAFGLHGLIGRIALNALELCKLARAEASQYPRILAVWRLPEEERSFHPKWDEYTEYLLATTLKQQSLSAEQVLIRDLLDRQWQRVVQ